MRTVHDLMRLDGRVALVTGGAGQLGRTMGAALAEAGATVIVLDLDADRADAVAMAFPGAQHGALGHSGMAADLSDPDTCRAVPHRIAERHGRLDILIHCAALVGTTPGLDGWMVPFERQGLGAWSRSLDLNLTALFLLVQESLPLLRASPGASVIAVSSIYGLVGPDWSLYDGTRFANAAAYAASKGGVIQLARWMATTLAPEVRVNALAPGGVYNDTPEPFHSRYVRRTPLGRMAEAEDLKGAALYLASDLSRYVTGQCLVVDGGWTAW